MKFSLKRLPNLYLAYLIVLSVWIVIFLITQAPWQNFIILPAGAFVGHMIWEINWFFPKKEVVKLLPLILLIPAIFVLTSTDGVLGKAVVVFLYLRLLLDKRLANKDNQSIR